MVLDVAGFPADVRAKIAALYATYVQAFEAELARLNAMEPYERGVEEGRW